MPKVVIQVEETIRYEDEITVIQPEEMTDEEFEMVLSKAERSIRHLEGGAKDLAHALEQLGLKIELQTFSFPGSPRNSELEILDVRDVK